MYSQTSQTPSFLSFIFDDNQHHKYLRLILIACAVQFVVFKILYPFPDFFSDSYSFIATAAKGENFNIWPIGYSKFLYAVRTVTSSSLAVVAIQYFVMTFSSLAFFFSILYFYSPSRQVTWILFAFLFLNPAVLYLCNYISSDPLFSGLSLLGLHNCCGFCTSPSVGTFGLMLCCCSLFLPCGITPCIIL